MSRYSLVRMNVPAALKGDDNVGNVYGVVTDRGLIGFVYQIPSSRSWGAIREDGSHPLIDATTRGYAADLLCDDDERMRADAAERAEQALVERATTGNLTLTDLEGAVVVGTIDRDEAARMIKHLAEALASSEPIALRMDISRDWSRGTGRQAIVSIGQSAIGTSLHLSEGALRLTAKGA